MRKLIDIPEDIYNQLQHICIDEKNKSKLPDKAKAGWLLFFFFQLRRKFESKHFFK